MPSPRLIKRWEVLTAAVTGGDWRTAAVEAGVLEDALRRMARARSCRGPEREAARREHRDGLFGIGLQRIQGAPAEVQAAIGRYNSALLLIPGGVGPQPKGG